MSKANLHPNPLSGVSEDYPDPDEDDPYYRDFIDPNPCPVCHGTGRVHELSPGDFASIAGYSGCSACQGTGFDE